MAALPDPIDNTATRIYAAYESDADNGNRPHLGASIIGHACERNLWLTFRWVDEKKFNGRMLRLFETGQLEEARIVKNLRRTGIEVHETDPAGRQWRVSDIGGHFAGSMDGAGIGFVESPKKWHVLEFKTHNDKSFKELQAKGVEKAKPMHHAQMQVYMGLTGMQRAMYIAVNKNTDEIYSERLHYDEAVFNQLHARAERVIRAAEPPLRLSNDPSWYVCKFCDFAEHCHGETAPAVNCRTCAHSTPVIDSGEGQWDCSRTPGTCEPDIPLEVQRKGCSSHRVIPILLERFAKQVDVVDGDVVYEQPNGQRFANGEQPGSLTSQEIRQVKDKTMLAEMAQLKGKFAAVGIEGEVIA